MNPLAFPVSRQPSALRRWLIRATIVLIACLSLSAVSERADAHAVNAIYVGTNASVTWHFAFKNTPNFRSEACLSAPNANLANSPSAYVWSCAAANSFLNWNLMSSDGYTFILWNSAKQGCLHYGSQSDGAPITMNNDACNLQNQFQLWSIVQGAGHYYLVPANYVGQVVSISGSSPTDGALVHMWHAGANSDQLLDFHCYNPNASCL
jgi:hypothetical protein